MPGLLGIRLTWLCILVTLAAGALDAGFAQDEPPGGGEPAAEETAPVEEESGGGLCPLSMIMVPMVLAAVVLVRKRQ